MTVSTVDSSKKPSSKDVENMISPEIKAALDAVAKAKETAQVVSGYAQAYGITKGQPAKIMQSSLQGLSSS